MDGRSIQATPVTRRVPLLLTVLVSAIIHVLLLAAGWALIRADHPDSQGAPSLSLVIGVGEPSPATESSALPEPSTASETTALPTPPANTDTAPVETASVPPVTAEPLEGGLEQMLTTTADTRSAVQAESQVNSQVNPALAEPLSRPRLNEPVPEMQMQMLDSQAQARVLEALDQLADMNITTVSQTGETLTLADGSQFAIDVEAVSAPGLTELARYEVTLSQRQGAEVFSTRAILQERAFSWYAKFINRWDTDVFLANDRVVGRFHANTPVNFSTDRREQPVFSGPVSLAGYQGISRRLRNSGMFAQGIETGIGPIDMPDAVAPTVFTLAETSLDVHPFSEHTRLEFLADGGFRWTQSGSRSGIIRPVSGNATLIVADDRAVLELSGVVSGVVSVFAPRRLSIVGNLTYASGLPAGNGQQHFLTLISNGIIEVAGPTQTEPGDLEIQAALFARQRFSVRRFNSRPQGELIIRGTLVAGSVSATEPRYTTRIEYDSRFESVRPPAFPTTGMFDIETWDKQWRITAVSDDSPATAPDMTLPVVVE